MNRDALAQTIYATFAAPYGDYLTPALRQQLRICAGQAADRVLAQMSAAIDRATVTPAHPLERPRRARTVKVERRAA